MNTSTQVALEIAILSQELASVPLLPLQDKSACAVRMCDVKLSNQILKQGNKQGHP